jgi:hypothetical protein
LPKSTGASAAALTYEALSPSNPLPLWCGDFDKFGEDETLMIGIISMYFQLEMRNEGRNTELHISIS